MTRDTNTKETIEGRFGISLAIMLFITTIAIGILWVIFFQDPVITILDLAESRTTNQAALDGINYVRQFANNLLLIIMGVGAFGLIADAAFERSGGT